MKKPFLVIVGKSGAGKDYCFNSNENLVQLISETSRPIRENIEKEGRDYYYKTQTEMNNNLKNGKYWEWVEYSGFNYAFSYEELERVINKYKDKIPTVKVTIEGLRQVFESRLVNDYDIEIVYFDIQPDLQEKRIVNRAKISTKELEARMKTNEEFDDWYKNNKNKVTLYLKTEKEEDGEKVVKEFNKFVTKLLKKSKKEIKF